MASEEIPNRVNASSNTEKEQASSTTLAVRYFPSLIYPRMLGYALVIVMHSTIVIHISNIFKGDALKDPDMKHFHDSQFKLLTVWNVYMQLFYSTLGLSCEVISLASEEKDSAILKLLKKIREPLFSCIVFPASLTVSTIFWTIYNYDHHLIIPPSVEKSLSSTANHIIHTAIVPVVLWELLFRPRKTPDSHVPNLVLLNTYAAGYLIVLVSSYLQLGIWVYPVLNILNGTIYLYLLLGVSTLSVQFFYYLQWYLNGLIWGSTRELKKVD